MREKEKRKEELGVEGREDKFAGGWFHPINKRLKNGTMLEYL